MPLVSRIAGMSRNPVRSMRAPKSVLIKLAAIAQPRPLPLPVCNQAIA